MKVFRVLIRKFFRWVGKHTDAIKLIYTRSLRTKFGFKNQQIKNYLFKYLDFLEFLPKESKTQS